MKSIEDVILECEKESFQEAAKLARQYRTQLVFEENGKTVKRTPNQHDLTGSDIELIKLQK